MTPLYTLLLCLPAVLVLIACICGLAALWSPTTRSSDYPAVDRRRATGGHADGHIPRV
jgi:hypothetical protein